MMTEKTKTNGRPTSSTPSPVDSLLNAFTSRAKKSNCDSVDFVVVARLQTGFLCISKLNRSSIVIPCANAARYSIRSDGFEARAIVGAKFVHDGKSWTENALLVECVDENELQTFCHLGADILNSLEGKTAEEMFSTATQTISGWLSFFKKSRILSPEAELGLWGELTLLSDFVDVNAGVDSWCGPDREESDFHVDGISIEVKSSTSPQDHYFSLSQTANPLDPMKSLFLSLWVKKDPLAGTDIVTLARSIGDRMAQPWKLIKKVGWNICAPEAAASFTRYALASQGLWFRRESIPTVHGIDPDVISVRYRATLDPAKAVAPCSLGISFLKKNI